MVCPARNDEQLDLLLDYCSGHLSADSAAKLERHMADCAECRSIAAAQRGVLARLDEWDEVSVSPEFDRKLYQRIAEEERGSHFWERCKAALAGMRMRPVIPFAAAATAALAIVLLRPAPDPAPRADNVDIEQMEQALEDMELLGELQSGG